ncbi:MAG: LLM class flavin-dependent oxidoreductase [Dehalococcoidia bacterium]|nr:LLM class flavin-dependent oxidoreductase [Dehalococcoidia bacterium]
MDVSLFYLPAIGSRDEIEQGMAGLRTDLYQRMLAEIKEQAQLADQLDYNSISFTEHHFHVEGFEISNNPVLLDLFVGLNTSRIRVGQLGLVLPSQNPIRVAEDIAMLDHMTGGRANAGFARGYQRRWVDIMAQQLHGIHGAIPGEHDEFDRANRQAFEEHFQIIKKAWTEDTLEYQGKYWKIPTDQTPWPLKATKLWGSGVDENDILQHVSVVPKPLQKPHPPIFQPFASSENTIRWCAREDVTAILPAMHRGMQNQLYEVYRDEAEKAGRKLQPGEGLGLLRDVIIADTDEEAMALWRRGAAFVGAAWFAPFGFDRVLVEPERVEPLSHQDMLDRSLILVGSPDSVSRQLENLMKDTPLRWLFAWTYNGLVPHEKLMRSIELFATKVLPRFQD